LSGIEADSTIIRRKIAYAGIDKNPVFRNFLVTWMAEEAEHARALAAMALQGGIRVRPPQRSAVNPKDVVMLCALRVGAPRVLHAAYCVLGAAQEYTALSTYAESGAAL
jgi:hypothetical protein